MNAGRLIQRLRDALKPSRGCPVCTAADAGFFGVSTGELAARCTCTDRCDSAWCQVSRITSGEFLHTHRVRSDADKLFDEVKDLPRRDRSSRARNHRRPRA